MRLSGLAREMLIRGFAPDSSKGGLDLLLEAGDQFAVGGQLIAMSPLSRHYLATNLPISLIKLVLFAFVVAKID